MDINNNYNLSFGTKFRTAKILEAATFKYTESDSIADLKPIIDEFWYPKLKATWNRGYRYYIKNIADKINEKYPEIKKAADEILEFANKNPHAKKPDYQEFVKPIIDRLGETIDITL